jgi:hypothetical protein
LLEGEIHRVDTTTVTTNLDGMDMYDYSTNTDCAAARVLPASGRKGWFMSLNPVNGKPVTVCFGCVQKNGVGANATISADKIKPNIKNIRKRVCSYTSGDN